MHINKLVIAAAMSFMAGCQVAPPLPVAAPTLGVSHTKIAAALQAITVTASENQLSGFFIDTQAWQSALQESVDRMAIFEAGAPTRVAIAVEILGFDTPHNDAAVQSNAIARYKILNQANGDILFNEAIISTGVASNNASLTMDARIRESRSRAVEQNIADFLKSLETAAIKLPATYSGKATH